MRGGSGTMLYYSTNHTAARATLRDAVVRGLAEDRGLYMPEVIKQLPASFWDEMADHSFAVTRRFLTLTTVLSLTAYMGA